MEDKSVAYTKGIDPDGFLVSLTARDEDLAGATMQLYQQIQQLELTPWQDGRNMYGEKSLVDMAKDLGGQVHLGEKVLPPRDAQAGDTYDMGVSLYSYDGEYLKFYKRIKSKDSADMQITKWPVCSLKLVEGNKDLDIFNELWPEWTPEPCHQVELPVGNQFLSFVVGPNRKDGGEGNFYHNLVASRDA